MGREIYVSKLHAFKVGTDGSYGTAIPMKGCVSLKTKNNYVERQYSSDGVIEYSSSNLESVEVEIEMTSAMALKLLAEITGQDYANGKMATRVGGQLPQLALAYEIAMDDGTTRRRVLYSVNLRKEEQSNETESEGEVWTLIGTAVPKEFGGLHYVDLTMSQVEVMASEDTTVKEEYEAFFTEVVMPS